MTGGLVTIGGVELIMSNLTLRMERIGSSNRAFAGNLRSTVRAEKRIWQGTTTIITQANATTVLAAIANAAQITVNIFGVGDVTCEVEATDVPYQVTGSHRALEFIIREV